MLLFAPSNYISEKNLQSLKYAQAKYKENRKDLLKQDCCIFDKLQSRFGIQVDIATLAAMSKVGCTTSAARQSYMGKIHKEYEMQTGYNKRLLKFLDYLGWS